MPIPVLFPILSSTLSTNQFLVHVVDLLADIMHEDLQHQELSLCRLFQRCLTFQLVSHYTPEG
jgi:hypothetical protein